MITKKGLNGHMRAKKLVQLLLIPMVCIGNMQSINEQDQQALFINRIADFWQEQDFAMAKNQILEFLQTYPESPYCHHFQAAIGDLYLNDEDYSNAISFYEKIQDKKTQEKIFPHKMQCYFALKNYTALLQEAKKALEENFLEDPSELHFFIATAFYYEIQKMLLKIPFKFKKL